MYQITYKLNAFPHDVYKVLCETIEQALDLAYDFLLCDYEIISIRKCK